MFILPCVVLLILLGSNNILKIFCVEEKLKKNIYTHFFLIKIKFLQQYPDVSPAVSRPVNPFELQQAYNICKTFLKNDSRKKIF